MDSTPEIEFVFLPESVKAVVKIIKERLDAGWKLFAINDDKAYFRKDPS